MLKKMLFLAMLAVGLAACEKNPLMPNIPKVQADTVSVTGGAPDQARPHGKKIEF